MILAFNAARDPKIAEAMRALIEARARRVADFPHLHSGKAGAISGSREVIATYSRSSKFRLALKITDAAVIVLAVAHCRQVWPPER